MDYARLNRWVDASGTLQTFHELMILPAQQLGRLDCRLLAECPSFLEPQTAERALAFQEHLTLAYLWVLGGYELVRVIDQRYREDPALAPEVLRTRANQVKKTFERVRIPLATFEPSRVHRKTHSAFVAGLPAGTRDCMAGCARHFRFTHRPCRCAS